MDESEEEMETEIVILTLNKVVICALETCCKFKFRASIERIEKMNFRINTSRTKKDEATQIYEIIVTFRSN